MRGFLLRFAVVLAFTLVLLGGLEWFLRANDETKMALKKRFLLENAADLKGLAVGSSQLWRAIDAARLTPLTHNMGLTAGDLYSAVHVAHFALDRIQPDFLMVELPPPYLEHLRKEDWYEKRRIFYYYGFKRGRRTIKDHFLLRHPAYRLLAYSLRDETYDERGFSTSMNPKQDIFRQVNYDPDSIAAHPYTVQRLRSHSEIMDDEAYAINVDLLDKLLARCRANNIKVVFLDVPKYYLYNEATNPVHLTRRQRFLDRVVDSETVFFWDYSRFGEREAERFYNFTHVGREGAEVFTDSLQVRILEEFYGE